MIRSDSDLELQRSDPDLDRDANDLDPRSEDIDVEDVASGVDDLDADGVAGPMEDDAVVLVGVAPLLALAV